MSSGYESFVVDIHCEYCFQFLTCCFAFLSIVQREDVCTTEFESPVMGENHLVRT